MSFSRKVKNVIKRVLRKLPGFSLMFREMDACQKTIIDILMDKFSKAIKQTGIKTVAIGGGVSANSGVRNAVCP